MNHLFLIHDGTNSWYVADSGHAALALFVADQYGMSFSVEAYAKECPETTVSMVPDDELFTLDLGEYPMDNDEITLTAGEWAAQSEPGLFASSEW